VISQATARYTINATPQLRASVPRAPRTWNMLWNGVVSQLPQSWMCETIVLPGEALSATNRIPSAMISATIPATRRITRASVAIAPAPAEAAIRPTPGAFGSRRRPNQPRRVLAGVAAGASAAAGSVGAPSATA
jgi:hypothetical protein